MFDGSNFSYSFIQEKQIFLILQNISAGATGLVQGMSSYPCIVRCYWPCAGHVIVFPVLSGSTGLVQSMSSYSLYCQVLLASHRACHGIP